MITNINYLYDNSNPTLYTTSIINKEIYTSGEKIRINVDQVVVSPWGNMNGNSVVAVSEDSYNQVSENERVFIGLKHGLLGISWYYLEL
ncbi:hypothetical protein [Clostridium manihotivorum]|uniref:hypothetical protein n=1 Tax=Clostridium manihotivorum TaxID=2320868 RepID=UPI000FE43AA1|nr:hypothetical protein [Clostridium manihotivorum]